MRVDYRPRYYPSSPDRGTKNISVIHVSTYYQAPSKAEEINATRMISLLDPGAYIKRPSSIKPSDHLTLGFHDIQKPARGRQGPSENDMFQLLEFSRAWNGNGPIVVHCHAGVSRSPTAALIILAAFNPGREQEAVAVLRRAIPHATLNGWMVRIAAPLLGCDGELVNAVQAVEAPADIYAEPFPISLRL
jgi:predicted protein tyrosine phosphatase